MNRTASPCPFSPALARALRSTADRLRHGARYEWGHIGRCNCGHLVQTLTGFSDQRIHAAFRERVTEWTELANDYCAATGRDMDEIFAVLHRHGLSHADVHHLEHLSDPRVLAYLPERAYLPDGRRHLARNERDDVVLYLDAMADWNDAAGCLEPAAT